MAEPTQTRAQLAIAVSPELCVLLAALAALTLAAACRHTSASPAPSVEMRETSAGDTAWCGALRPGTHAILRGHVGASGCDTSDSFAFVATSACRLRCRVRPALPGVDLALRAVDVANGRTVKVPAGVAAQESGTVRIERAGCAIDLVVSASWGSSSYTLDVEALALGPEEPARALRVPLARAPLANRGFYVETALGPTPASALR